MFSELSKTNYARKIMPLPTGVAKGDTRGPCPDVDRRVKKGWKEGKKEERGGNWSTT